MSTNDSPLFHRILVGVDEEGRADHAVAAALGLATVLGSRVGLIHAVPTGHPRWWRPDPVRIAAANAELLTQGWIETARRLRALDREGRPLLEEHLRILSGKPARALSEAASPGDLLVLGPHRRRGRIDFGSTARAVLARAPCPVWVQVEAPAEIRRILVPLDLSEEGLAALELGRALARALGASVTVLHCFEAPVFSSTADGGSVHTASAIVDEMRDSTRERMAEVLDGVEWGGVPHDELLVDAQPVERILELQDTTDLVVMGTRGPGAVSATLLGSTAYGVLREARVPVLAIRHPKAEDPA